MVQVTENWYKPVPPMKNGRFSWKNVSNAERLSNDGSASTCPKSGLTVASIVTFGVRPSLMSAPAVTCCTRSYDGRAFTIVGSDELFATVYGVTSRRRENVTPDMPSRRP